MKSSATAGLCCTLAASAYTALADHGADPARELPIWLLIAVAVVVGLVFSAASAIRKRSRRKRGD